jgi:excisionase family DNA binding protein
MKTNTLDDYNDILLPEDLQEILQVGRNTIYAYLKLGVIKSIKIGKKYRIPKKCLIEFLNPDVSEIRKE